MKTTRTAGALASNYFPYFPCPPPCFFFSLCLSFLSGAQCFPSTSLAQSHTKEENREVPTLRSLCEVKEATAPLKDIWERGHRLVGVVIVEWAFISGKCRKSQAKYESLFRKA